MGGCDCRCSKLVVDVIAQNWWWILLLKVGDLAGFSIDVNDVGNEMLLIMIRENPG